MYSPKADDPAGVPISAIIFGGRRASTIPLVMQSFNWTHGVYLGAMLGSETTAAAIGKVGVLRRDPMAMIPFCGYNMGGYFQHWLEMRHNIANPPKIFLVNWFRKDDKGSFVWPGYGENMRVLQWVLQRALGRIGGQETVVGWVPREGDLDLSGCDITSDQFEQATRIDPKEWLDEVESQQEFFDLIGDSMPEALKKQRELLRETLKTVPGIG